MSLTFELAMVPKFGLEVSPALVTFGELLMLPYAAMQSVVADEVSTNEALERLEAAGCPICHGSWQRSCPVCSPSGAGSSDASGLAAPDAPADEPDTVALLRAVRLELSAADGLAAEYLIDSFDRHGLLDRSVEQFAMESGIPEPVVTRVLDVIRRCAPPGVGATSINECLLLQLDGLGLGDDHTRVARAVIADHLESLARGHFASIACALGVSRREVRQVLDLIRDRLRPYPAFHGNVPLRTSYVVPDIVVRADDGMFFVELVEPALTRLRVRPEPGAPAESIALARSFLAQLRDRWDTLRRVAEYAVQRQRDSLTNGDGSLKPLTRAEVAVALDLHESTVSRAVAGKYVLLPDQRLVPLSRFFGASGGVDHALRELLESADGPLSDQHLADRLRARGYPIARRTVAKHRARLGFAAVSLR
ncbi:MULTISPECIES: RNA polymerase factor sigma-54 [unclassified Kribbella]|uniref:RNA polymerase factor sigma-54 n=1 Tax=unclassified Kribbella TaxID=2644121 RepID=UPI00301A93B0